MLLISHRGNIDSIRPELENTPAYIDAAITAGYDVEIDVWGVGGRLFLGHDEPVYHTTLGWLLERKGSLWIHTKNFDALHDLIDKDVRTFFHQHEEHTIINNCNLIWSHNIFKANNKCIIPLLTEEDMSHHWKFAYVYGICSDFVAQGKADKETE